MQLIVRTYDSLLTAMAVLAMTILPITALAVTYEVVMRYAFNRPTIWAVDLAAFSLLWITFLASPWLVRNNGHITIEFFVALLRPRQRLILRAIVFVLAAGVSALLLWETSTATYQAFVRRVLTIGSWEIPRAYVWMVMPVGSLFLVIEFIRGSVVAVVEARQPVAPPPAPPPEEAVEDLTGSI